MTKNLDWSLDWSDRERKSLKTFWKSVWTRENQCFKKTLYTIFDWSKIRFNRSKMLWLMVQYQLSIDRSKQRLTKVFNRNFNWSKNKFDRSKFWKKQIFEKTKQFCVETPQSIEFYEWNACVWDEMFFKNTSFEPNFPNLKIFNPFS